MITLDERIRRYLDKCPPAVSGSDGHGQTLKVAVALVWGFALEPEEALRYLTIYNDKCDPPWKPHELRHKVSDAAKVAHSKPRGHLLGTQDRPKQQASRVEPKPAPLRLKPKKGDLRTVRTFISDLRVNVCARTHTLETGVSFRPSEPSEKPEAPKSVEPTQKPPSEPSAEWPLLVAVPDCPIPKPPEVVIADADWRAVVASGLSQEEQVQHALFLFGPCRVLETGAAS